MNTGRSSQESTKKVSTKFFVSHAIAEKTEIKFTSQNKIVSDDENDYSINNHVLKVFNRTTKKTREIKIDVPAWTFKGKPWECVFPTPQGIIVSTNSGGGSDDTEAHVTLLDKNDFRQLDQLQGFRMHGAHYFNTSDGNQQLIGLVPHKEIYSITINANKLVKTTLENINTQNRREEIAKLNPEEKASLLRRTIAFQPINDDEYLVVKFGGLNESKKQQFPEDKLMGTTRNKSSGVIWIYRWKRVDSIKFNCDGYEAFPFYQPLGDPMSSLNFAITRLQGKNFMIEGHFPTTWLPHAGAVYKGFRIINSDTLTLTPGFSEMVGTEIGFNGRDLGMDFACDTAKGFSRASRLVLPNGALLTYQFKFESKEHENKDRELLLISVDKRVSENGKEEEILKVEKIPVPALKGTKIKTMQMKTPLEVLITTDKGQIILNLPPAEKALDIFDNTPGIESLPRPVRNGIILDYLDSTDFAFTNEQALAIAATPKVEIRLESQTAERRKDSDVEMKAVKSAGQAGPKGESKVHAPQQKDAAQPMDLDEDILKAIEASKQSYQQEQQKPFALGGMFSRNLRSPSRDEDNDSTMSASASSGTSFSKPTQGGSRF